MVDHNFVLINTVPPTTPFGGGAVNPLSYCAYSLPNR
jgi:hypothetical protein